MIKNDLRSYADIVNNNINKDFEVITTIIHKYDAKENMIRKLKRYIDEIIDFYQDDGY